MKKNILFFSLIVLSILSFTSCKNENNVETPAETTLEETKYNTADIPLSVEDFILTYNGYKVDLLNAHDDTDAWWWQSYSSNDNVITSRGIKLGDNIDDVKVAYGDFELVPISKEEDGIYLSWFTHDGNSTEDFRNINDGDQYGEYRYTDKKNGKDYALGFFFDQDLKVKCILIYYGL